MVFNLYSANLKTWDHIGIVTPNIEFSEAARPAGEFKVAPWLPVQRQDKFNEEYIVISAGKAIALDRQGYVVPAGYKTLFASGYDSATCITYTATDVTEKVIDITTGVAVTAATTYQADDIETALIARGLIDTADGSDFISDPIGVAPYNYYRYCGSDPNNPATFVKHNYCIQPFVAILCKYVIELPLLPLTTGSVAMSAVGINSSAISDWTDTANTNVGEFFDHTGLSLTTRYANDITTSSTIIGYNLPKMHIAKNTAQTPIAFTATTKWVREVDAISKITTAGDYFIDYEVGVILVYSADGTTAMSSPGTVTFSYYDTVSTSTTSYAYATGNVRPGDFVKVDALSNFVVDTSPTVAATLGQVLEIESYPKDALDLVKTAFPQLAVADQMPGSATKGLLDKSTLAGSSNKVVRILLLK